MTVEREHSNELKQGWKKKSKGVELGTQIILLQVNKRGGGRKEKKDWTG